MTENRYQYGKLLWIIDLIGIGKNHIIFKSN